MILPIGVTAKNEARCLPIFLKSLRAAIAYAQNKLPVRFEIYIVLNDNTDHSLDLLSDEQNIFILQTYGGLVEAQRSFYNLKKESPFLIFSDADIILDEKSLYELIQPFIEESALQVTYVEKYPLMPQRKSLLAKSLYLYNLNNGYQNKRHYFNGQFFAIKNWNIPKASELQWLAVKDNDFLNLKAGIRCDDIFLSRDLLKRFGPAGIRCVGSALWYRPPETLRGMYRKYQRMRLEIERLHYFFPESQSAHGQWGQRQLQKNVIFSKNLTEIFYYIVFLIGLYLCKIFYNLQKIYYTYFSKYFSKQTCPTWKPVEETKVLG